MVLKDQLNSVKKFKEVHQNTDFAAISLKRSPGADAYSMWVLTESQYAKLNLRTGTVVQTSPNNMAVADSGGGFFVSKPSAP
jgi:hypothetical protein